MIYGRKYVDRYKSLCSGRGFTKGNKNAGRTGIPYSDIDIYRKFGNKAIGISTSGKKTYKVGFFSKSGLTLKEKLQIINNVTL